MTETTRGRRQDFIKFRTYRLSNVDLGTNEYYTARVQWKRHKLGLTVIDTDLNEQVECLLEFSSDRGFGRSGYIQSKGSGIVWLESDSGSIPNDQSNIEKQLFIRVAVQGQKNLELSMIQID